MQSSSSSASSSRHVSIVELLSTPPNAGGGTNLASSASASASASALTHGAAASAAAAAANTGSQANSNAGSAASGAAFTAAASSVPYRNSFSSDAESISSAGSAGNSSLFQLSSENAVAGSGAGYNSDVPVSPLMSAMDTLHSHSVSRTNSESSFDTQLSRIHSTKWQQIPLSQLIELNKLVFISGSISVEEAFNTLVKYNLTSLPVENFPDDIDCLTFDYNDLNSYLLLVLNKISVNNAEVTKQCQLGHPVPVGEIIKLTPKNPFYKLPEQENLSTAMMILGSGVHRVAITNQENTQIKGILSQRRLIKYLWDNARSFQNLETLFQKSLKDLRIGVLDTHTKPTTRQSRIISVQGDDLLIMALYKMHTERISSIAVIDHQGNLLGNISVTDVKHITRTSQYPLLQNTCLHFISVILDKRGLEMGKDSFPIFHVYPTSSLARTVAKLVATKAHRLWIVQPSGDTPVDSEKDKRSGKLIGVVSLTDILGLLARHQTEFKKVDPLSARRQRGSVV
ncbi:unnamed protein product [Kluyveromyces dobzhanskii CBS 2104]|uniref:WGS project CCBQ000000000 data, contig 00272 n=1 Tax=Kluyveromyces dobzhanskii CBS 2104 TaxID=1427455 RepID=A0A0A8LAY5_9SACH|nr:unnamed protein product [Kluyveromyces dobzhanskii CBS 2104]